MRKSLRRSVVVITGASSGIGRAAAIAFARRGASVVLAARNRPVLEQVAAECVSLGVRALAIPMDVRDEGAVRDLAHAAFEAFGRIDVWVNNAAVALYARIDEAPYDAYRQVIETNLLGYVNGARAVLPYFRLQGAGVLIDNASAFGKIGSAKFSAYVISKFGIVGLDSCLRQELFDTPNVHVCTLLPSTMDSPVFHHAGNYTGKAIKPLPPIYAPERVAEAMVSLAERPRSVKYVGSAGPIVVAMHALAPNITDRLFAAYAERYGYGERAAPHTDGNIFEPMSIWTGVTGGWGSTSGLPAIFELATRFAGLALERLAPLRRR